MSLLGVAGQVAGAVAGDIGAGLNDGAAQVNNAVQSALSGIITIPGLPPFPDPKGATLNLGNIQHDILVGMTKTVELFFFFGISNAATFKTCLASDIKNRITSVTQILTAGQQPTTAVNIAFSASGLRTLGIDPASLAMDTFTAGQWSDKSFLGDSGTSWVPEFMGTSIHGLLMLQSDTIDNINDELSSIKSALGTSIVELYQLQGGVRPGDQVGHEHFGYLDGISQPAVNGYTTSPLPGQALVDPGVFLLGENGDTSILLRPAWAKDSSFLAFRQLQQKVPEFKAYLLNNALTEGGRSQEDGAQLLGARMVGRWPSGAPVVLAPTADDPALGKDPQRNNNFDYVNGLLPDESLCPYSAHLRKVNPRGDFPTPPNNNRILRSSIPYGPEVTAAETASGVSDPSNERGLAFACYQTNLDAGFRFIQNTWSNDPLFFPGRIPIPGFDPIIGANFGNARTSTGLDPANLPRSFDMEADFVIPRGGEYFLTPSISALSYISGV